jgi:hypothetical protein
MTLKEFIKENKEDLDAAILRANPGNRMSDSERRLWVMNDEGLYKWAKSEGVKI